MIKTTTAIMVEKQLVRHTPMKNGGIHLHNSSTIRQSRAEKKKTADHVMGRKHHWKRSVLKRIPGKYNAILAKGLNPLRF